MRAPPLRALLPAAALLGALTASLSAQSILVAEFKNKPCRVETVHGSRPFVTDNGKLVAAESGRYAFHKIEDFLPVFVAVRGVKVGTRGAQFAGSGTTINNEFLFRGDFSSAYPLDNVYIALELTFESGEKSIFLREVGHLDADHSRSVDVALRTSYPFGKGRYQLHIYSQGVEVLHSQQPFAAREAALDRFVAKRLHDRPDGPPQPFIGPPPEYPEKLLKAKTTGHATLKLRVRATGAVVDVSVVEATDPAFGEAALESMRQWRFYPRKKDGRPVDTVVEMPINFKPPAAAKSD